MQDLNTALFQILGGGHRPDAHLLWLASGIAQYASWLCFALMGWAAWRYPAERLHVLGTLLAAGVASLLAHVLANAIGMPRPFVVGLSPSYIEHGVRGSLPSAHATVMFTVGLLFCLRAALRRTGLVLLAIAVLTGWARVYVGVHFPLDVVAGLVLAGAITAAYAGLQALIGRYIVPRVPRGRTR